MLKAFVLAFLTSSLANAQDASSISASDVLSAPQESPAINQSVTNAGPSPKSALHLTLGSENLTYEADSRAFPGKAPVMSYNWVGAIYNLNSTWAFHLEQNFQVASNRENISGGRDKALHNQAFEMSELMLSTVYTPITNFLGSSSQSTDFRYYAPTDHLSQENKELGRLRSDTYVNWTFNPRWSASAYMSARVLLNSKNNVNTEKGSDAEFYQLRLGPIATYNFNDKISAYYGNFTNMKSSQAQRGNWNPDVLNINTQEVGGVFNWGPYTVNPALTTDTNFGDSSGALLTSSSRAFSYETLGYNLNLYATF